MQDSIPVILLAAIPLLIASYVVLSRPGRADHFNRDAPPQPKLREPDVESLSNALKPLTPRERQVALLAARGLTNRQIATEVGLSIHTVNNHLKRVYAKLEVSSRTELAWRLQYVEISRNEPSDSEE